MIPLNQDILPGLGSSVLYCFSLPSAGVTEGFRGLCELPAAAGPGASCGGIPARPGTNAACGEGRRESSAVPSGGSVIPRETLGIVKSLLRTLLGSAGSRAPGLGVWRRRRCSGAPGGLRPHRNATYDAKPQRQRSWALYFSMFLLSFMLAGLAKRFLLPTDVSLTIRAPHHRP